MPTDADEEQAPKSAGQMDPHKAVQVGVFGMKGSGKSELLYRLFDTYPYDKVAIDPNADLKMPEGTFELEPPIPGRWPTQAIEEARARTVGEKPKPQVLYFAPDFHEATYIEDMDAVVGMSYSHGRACLLFDEVHEGAPANRTPPHMRRTLRQGRHREQTNLLATPRPLTVDPLVISNADWVYVFMLPNPNDRKRVAENIGWDPKDFDAAVMGLGDYEYLRYEARTRDLAHFPALPLEVIKHHRPR
jgi:hypothetical protein